MKYFSLTQWPIQKIMLLNVIIIILVITISNGIIYLNISEGRNDNLNNIVQAENSVAKTQKFITKHLPLLKALSSQELLIKNLKYEFEIYVLEETGESEELNGTLNKIISNQKILANIWDNRLSNKLIQQLQDNIIIVQSIIEEAFDTSDFNEIQQLARDSEDILNLLINTIHEIEKNLNQISEKVCDSVLEGSQLTKLNIKKLDNTLKYLIKESFFIMGIIVILLLVSQGLFFITLRNRLRQIVERLKDIAVGDGDLTKRLTIKTKDELGELSTWFNAFIGQIHNIIKDIAVKSQTIINSSKELTDSSKDMSEASITMNAKSDSITSSAKEMTDNMHSIATSSKQTTSKVGMIVTTIEELNSTINEISLNTEKAATVTTEAVSLTQTTEIKINSLGNAVRDINKVTEAITTISKQTNLLALNATIEAARAGNAGKGFAVVANEIKELAKQTEQAVLEIKERINSVQDSASETVTDIKKIINIIDTVNEIVSIIATSVEEQSVSSKEIVNNLSQTSQGIKEIDKNVGETMDFSKYVTDNIIEISCSANNVSDSCSYVTMKAEEFFKLASQLNNIVTKFQI